MSLVKEAMKIPPQFLSKLDQPKRPLKKTFRKKASLVKVALQSEQERRAKQRESYLRNREQRRRAAKMWKLEHAAEQKRYRRRYQRQVKAGVRVAKKRARAGLGYQFLGSHPPVNTETSTPSQELQTMREKRF